VTSKVICSTAPTETRRGRIDRLAARPAPYCCVLQGDRCTIAIVSNGAATVIAATVIRSQPSWP
jgi:hypothetical protein